MRPRPRNSWASCDRSRPRPRLGMLGPGCAHTRILCTVFIGAAIAGGGCRQRPPGLPELAPVTGRVLFKGQPLAGAVLRFESAGGQVSIGRTDAEGRYVMAFSRDFPGVAIGPNTVRITSGLDAPPGPGYVDPVPSRYNVRSALSALVAKGPNTFDFELTSAP